MARDGWTTAFRDTTPDDDDLSDLDFDAYLEGNDLSRNFDISNRVDYAQVPVNPFTIAAQNAVISNSKKTSSSSRPSTSKTKTKKNPTAAQQQQQPQAEEEKIKVKTPEPSQDPPSETTFVTRKKKRVGLLDLGDFDTFHELEEAARQQAKKPGQSIEPAVPQPKVAKDDKKKQNQNQWPARKNGWTDCRGNPVGGVSRPKTKPKSTLDELNEMPRGNQSQNQGKAAVKKPVPAPKVPPKSIIQQLDEEEAKERAAKAAAEAEATKAKKKPAKKEPAKGTKAKGKGKGKASAGDDEEKVTFQHLPAGASTNSAYPIVDGINKMKNLPKKNRVSKSESPLELFNHIPLDSLIPLTKLGKGLTGLEGKGASSDKKGRPKFVGKPSTLSAEFIDSSQSGRDSVDPPSDIEAAPKKKIILPSFLGAQAGRGNTSRKTVKSQDPSPDRDDDMIPSLAHTNPTEPTDHLLTPHHAGDYIGNPSTMTHLSAMEPHLSDRTSGSSQFPYSSPALDKARRMERHVYAPQPIRDKSREISSLQALVSRGQGQHDASTPIRSLTGKLPLQAQHRGGQQRDDPDRSDDDREGDGSWSTFPSKQYRNAQKSKLNDRKDVYGPGSSMRAIPFPKAQPPPLAQQSHAQPKAQQDNQPRYSKLTLFQPTPLGDLYKRDDVEYTIAAIPNGASSRNDRQNQTQNQYQVEPMQWKGSQRDYNERQKPIVPQKPRWMEEAERARPHVEEEDWREQWKAGGKKRELSNNPLSRYALKEDKRPKYDMEGRGQAFR